MSILVGEDRFYTIHKDIQRHVLLLRLYSYYNNGIEAVIILSCIYH